MANTVDSWSMMSIAGKSCAELGNPQTVAARPRKGEKDGSPALVTPPALRAPPTGRESRGAHFLQNHYLAVLSTALVVIRIRVITSMTAAAHAHAAPATLAAVLQDKHGCCACAVHGCNHDSGYSQPPKPRIALHSCVRLAGALLVQSARHSPKATHPRAKIKQVGLPIHSRLPRNPAHTIR